jgi:cholesterol oxidase
MLGVRPLPATLDLAKARAFRAVGRRIGATVLEPNLAIHFGNAGGKGGEPAYVRDPHDLGVNVLQADCQLCGECIIGCRFGAKNTLDQNYLAVAEQRHAATIRPLAEVQAIAPEDGGYRVHYRDRTTFEQMSIWAPLVVVSAGTVNTVELLLRCRDEFGLLPRLGSALGEHFSPNGDFLACALDTEQPVDPWNGPVITTALRYLDDRFHFYLEEGALSSDSMVLLAAVTMRAGYFARILSTAVGHGARLRNFYEGIAGLAEEYRRHPEEIPPDVMIFLGMGQDAGDGRIALQKRLFGRPLLTINWEHTRSMPLFGRMEAEFQRIATQLGGQYMSNVLWSMLGRLITVHPLGGCAIADDEADGVLNPFGEVWGYRNLYVADGSVIPRSLGPNPSLTIAALAERTAEHIVS